MGSAVEHAARLANPDCEVDFQNLFLMQEEVEEESTSLADVLSELAKRWPMTFSAANVAELVNDWSDPTGATIREFLYPSAPPNHIATPKSVGKLLKSHLDEPVRHGERTFILRAAPDTHASMWIYFVHISAV